MSAVMTDRRNFLNEAFEIHLDKFKGPILKEHVSAAVEAFLRLNIKSEKIACLMKKVFDEAVKTRVRKGLKVPGVPRGS